VFFNIGFRFISNCKWIFARWQYHCDSTRQQMHKSNTQLHITHIITLLKTNKEKQNSSQSYTNSEGHITGNEYSIEKG
jgi:hypothetical protein